MPLQYVEKKQPLDLLFLDIEMEGNDGIQAGQWIQEKVEYAGEAQVMAKGGGGNGKSR